MRNTWGKFNEVIMNIGRFSHPVATLNNSAVTVNNGAGVVEGITGFGSNGNLCSSFEVRAQVAYSPWKTSSTTVCITVDGAIVLDVYGTAFPTSQNCSTLDHQCEAPICFACWPALQAPHDEHGAMQANRSNVCAVHGIRGGPGRHHL